MNEKEAIEVLCNTGFLATEENSAKLEDAIRAAVYALDKRVPKQPFGRREGYGYCPFCERAVFNTSKFCGDCGQAIDWEEDEERGKK